MQTKSFIFLIILLIYQSHTQCQLYFTYSFIDPSTSIESCLPCAYNCLQCYNSTICTQCAKQYYLDESLGSCAQCGYGCSVCTNSQTCITCQAGLYIDSSGLCQPCDIGVSECTIAVVQKCSNGYFLLSSICAGCLSNCKICNDFVTCNTCFQGYYLSSANGTQSCLSCGANCLICTSPTTCTLCQGKYNLVNGACALYNCTNINTFCSKCSGGVCTQCQKGYYISSGNCLQGASILCNQAVGNSYVNCETSNQGCPSYATVQVIDSQTYDVCLPKRYTQFQQYKYYINKNITCPSNCSTPSMQSISITTKSYYKLIYYISIRLYIQNTHQIIIKLNNGTNTHSLDITNNLALNDIGCGCAYGQMFITGTFNQPGYNTTILSINSVNSSFDIIEYVVELSMCKVSYCESCTTAIDCSACQYPYLLQSIKCVSQCDSGFYRYVNDSIRKCLLQCPSNTYPIQSTYECTPCISPCLTCASQNECTSCISGYYLQSTTCSTQCSSNKLFPNSTSNLCQECPNPCSTCAISSSIVKCTSCNVGYLFNNSTCTYLCPLSTFGTFINSTSVCSSCDNTCTQCYISPSICNACTNGYLLYGSQCKQTNTCLLGYYVNTLANQNNVCLKCRYPCNECDQTASNCLTCKKGALLLATLNSNISINDVNRCPLECPATMYISIVGNLQKCQLCQSPCLTCQTAARCSTCINNTYLFNSSCLSKCPKTHYASNNICIPCIPPCIQCLNSTACLSCNTGYYDPSLFLCTLQCDSSSYISSNFTCTLCPSPCAQCFTAINCTQCSLPFVLDASGCVNASICTNSQLDSNGVARYVQPYQDNNNITLYSVCKLCTYPCQTCNSSSIVCLNCVASYILVRQLQTCVENCPISYYESMQVCQKCSNNCLECTSIATNCTKCSSGQYLDRQSNSSYKCVSICPSQYYGNTDQVLGGSCKPCQSPCKQCYTSFLCQSCVGALLLYNKNCVSKCPDGSAPNSALTECVLCATGCLTCKNSVSNCSSCASGYLFIADNFSCVSSCVGKFYANLISQVCQPCVLPCLYCRSSTQCINCTNNYYMDVSSSQCLSICPDGTFPNNSTYQCQSCNTTICSTCALDANSCISCMVGYFYNGTKCTKTCSSTTYGDIYSGMCKQCPYPCQTCTSNTNCLTCFTTYSLFQNRCYSQCPYGYYSNSSVCQPCSTYCQICTSFTKCIKCSTNYYVQLTNNTCLSNCPIGTYPGIQPITNYQQCMKCSTNCIQCTQAYKCIKCTSNWTLFNGLCISQCPTLYFNKLSQSNGYQCQPCGSLCSKCANETYCTECLNTYIYNNACYEQCPSLTYPYSDSECRNCKSPCKECLGDYTCVTCLAGYTYFHEYCIEQCPPDVWYYSGQPKCLQSCDQPNNRLLTSVLKSKSYKSPSLSLTKYPHSKMCFEESEDCGPLHNLVISNSYCLQSCPDGHYVNHKYKCVACSSNQQICQKLFKASLKVLRTDVLTLVLYFNQQTQITTIDQILIQFVDLDGKIISYNYTSYTIDNYQMRILYSYQQLSLVQVTVILPYLKSQSSNQCLNYNVFSAKINYYRSYFTYTPPSNLRALTTITTLSTYDGNSIINSIALAMLIIMLVLVGMNIVLEESHFIQILDFSQIIGLTLLLEIQYPPILQKMLHRFGIVLFNFLPSKSVYPYLFSQSKFITYYKDSSLLRQQPLLLIFITLLASFLIIAIIHRIRNKCKPSQNQPNKQVQINETNKTIQTNNDPQNVDNKWYDRLLSIAMRRVFYRHLNDTFSLLMSPILLFAFTFANASFLEMVISMMMIIICIGFISAIIYKILNIKKLSELTGLLSDLQPTSSIIGLMYTPFSHIRRIILCALIGIQPSKPLSALTLLLIFTILIMVCLIFYQPFQNQYSDYFSIGTEVVLTLYVFVILIVGMNVVGSQLAWILGTIGCVLAIFGLCCGVGWFAWMTIISIRKQWQQIRKNDVKDELIVSQQGAIVRQIKVNPKPQPIEKQMAEESANNLLMPSNHHKNDDLFSSSNQNNDGFKHWGDESSSNDHHKDPPQYLIKMNKNIQ